MQSVMHGVIVSRIAGDKYSPGFLASFFLHIPLGVTYIRALKAAECLTRGDFTKSAACTVAFAVIGSLARTSSGRTRTPRTVDQGTDGTARCCTSLTHERAAGQGADSAMRSVTPVANMSLSPALGCGTETMTNDRARGRAQGRGPQYEQA